MSFGAAVVIFLVIRQAVRDPRPTGRGANVALTGQTGDSATASTRPLFVDVTAEAGIEFVHVFAESRQFHLPEQMGSGGAFFDYDNDHDMDLYLVQSGLLNGDATSYRNRLYRNDGGRFVDVSQGSGADLTGFGMGCAAADVDNDGDVDLVVTRLGGLALLLNRNDGTFEEVSKSRGMVAEGFPTSAAFLDYNRDGSLDLYVTRYVNWLPSREDTCYAPSGARDYCGPLSYSALSTDLLFKNLGGGTFENASAAAGIDSAKGYGLGILATDFNNDGWVDIYVANDQTPGFMWINQKNGTFEEAAAMAGAAYNADGLAIAGMGTGAEDFDGDGDYDLLVTNIRNQTHLCLRNEGGHFEDVSHALGFGAWSVPFTGFGVAVFDQDHDGLLDGIIANGAVNMWGAPYRDGNPYAEPKQFFRLTAQGVFRDATSEAGEALAVADIGRSAFMGDYDGDGDMDVVITNNGGPAQLLRNENQSGHSWIMLDLIPAGGARNAINARVELLSGGKTYRREQRPHAGYLSSNDPRIHVGLGQTKEIDHITVSWPLGGKERWENVAVNQHLVLRQGTGQMVASGSN